MSVPKLLKQVPDLLHTRILASPFHAAKSDSLVLHSDESRAQTANVATCYKKLHQIIVDAAKESIMTEPSREQIARVKSLSVYLA